jgi:hypothetical protein
MPENQRVRYLPIERDKITKIFVCVRDNFDMETALTVSIQLQEYARLKQNETRYNELINMSNRDMLQKVIDNI